MTPTSRPVTRRCVLPSRVARSRRIIVTVGPGDMIALRPERTRQTEYIPVDAIYSMAVKLRVLAEGKERAAKKKAKAEARERAAAFDRLVKRANHAAAGAAS